ncbi:ammosamide/lymphostin RiPP family protein [Kroppenstedtia eburnea]
MAEEKNPQAEVDTNDDLDLEELDDIDFLLEDIEDKIAPLA